ncbi:MAG: hypothetical protein WA839_11865 [Flavobacteriaceae bacterium]
MYLEELNKHELTEVNGGLDEPAYGLGYYIGKGLHEMNLALGDLFFGSGWGFYVKK